MAGQVKVTFIGDSAKLKKTLNDVVSDLDKTENKITKTDRAFGALSAGTSKLGGAFKAFTPSLQTLSIGFAGLGAAAVLFGKQAYTAASSLDESMSKISVVFGDSSKEIVKWSKTSAKAMGLSQQQTLEAAGTYGNLFQAFGVTRKESAKMSKSLVGLASDLASFNNTSTDDALEALRSGLSGETEPLKRFGIAINDARLKDEALRLGLIKTTKDALKPGVKAQAAYALIMKDSSLAQGDFARTSDGAANKARVLQAIIGDLQAKVGKILVNAFLPLMSFVADKVIPGFEGVYTSVEKLVKGDFTGGLFGLNENHSVIKFLKSFRERIIIFNEKHPFVTFLKKVQEGWAAITSVIKSEVLPLLKDSGRVIKEELMPGLAELGLTSSFAKDALKTLAAVIIGTLLGLLVAVAGLVWVLVKAVTFLVDIVIKVRDAWNWWVKSMGGSETIFSNLKSAIEILFFPITGMISMIDEATKGWNDLYKIIKKIGDIIGDVSGKVTGTLKDTFGGKWIPQLNPAAGRALGGPVQAGMPYKVGEGGGPEWFVPSTDGHIVNARQTRDMGSTYNVTVNAGGSAITEKDLISYLKRFESLHAA